MFRLGALAIGYIFGNIQSAILIGKLEGVDIRSQGSGNAGTTNAIRVLGKKEGVLVFIIDALKSFFAALISMLLFHKLAGNAVFSGLFNGSSIISTDAVLVSLYAGIGTILGHSYPALFGFRGGKGIAVSAGMYLSLDWRVVIVQFFGFFIPCAITKIVSVSSLIMATVFPIIMFIVYGVSTPVGIETIILSLLISVFTFYRHRANITRILNGTEKQLTSKKKEA